MKIYTVTTLVEDAYSGCSAYSEPFLTEEDMNEYYESEIEYMKNEYSVQEKNTEETTPKTSYDGIVKKFELWTETNYIVITVRVCEK